MTGFGRGEQEGNGRSVVVEIKSVNHRYFEFSSRMGREYAFLENKLKPFVQEKIARGKVEAFVSIETAEESGAQVIVNHSLAAGYIDALRGLAERYHLKDDLSAGTMAQYPEIFTVRKAPQDEDEIWDLVRPAAKQALSVLLQMREAEGDQLKKDVLQNTRNILSLVEKVEERSPQTVQEYQQKLKQRISEMLGDADVGGERILTEAALFADKVSVAEETVRLRSHMEQLSSMLSSDAPIGRKLDFLVQEMNREANTIGSKCVDSQIAHLVVEMKAEIEKIREQIQNIE